MACLYVATDFLGPHEVARRIEFRHKRAISGEVRRAGARFEVATSGRSDNDHVVRSVHGHRKFWE
ncbi:MAG: hypothetical protein CL468_00840 [Acidimicrobiaceae bacterium]|nr:hypothetical protein [Acidimicrobiaceae bacterium]